MHGFFFRQDPKVKEVELLHAHDYANMSFAQMSSKLEDVKKNDENLRNSIE